jgi:hypothetical protein
MCLKISHEVLQSTASDAHKRKQTMQQMQLLLYSCASAITASAAIVSLIGYKLLLITLVHVHEPADCASGLSTPLTPVAPLSLTVLCANA